MRTTRETLRHLFDNSKEYVVATNSRLPVYDGSLLVGVRPVSVKLLLTQSGSEYVTWSQDHKAATITHSLACVPVVTVIDGSGKVVTPDVEVLSGTSFKLDFDVAIAIEANHPWICIIGYGAEYTDGQTIPAMPRVIDGPAEWGEITGNILEQTDLLNKLNTKADAPIMGEGAPTSSTAGSLGQFYINILNSKAYYCVAITMDDTDPQNPVTTYSWGTLAGTGGGGGGGGAWGEITGTLADQTDLNNALNAKQDTINAANKISYAYISNTPTIPSTAADVGAVPTTRTINSKALSSDIALDASDVGAIPTSDKGVANGVAGLDGNGLVSAAELPVATSSVQGISRPHVTGGIAVSQGMLYTNYANSSIIDARNENNPNDINTNTRNPITPIVLDYAVRSVSPNITVIPTATSSYNLLDATATTNNHSFHYTHSPSSAPSYTLPAVTDSTVTHGIILDVDFSDVQTIAFFDSGGNVVPLQKNIAIDQYDRYRFTCVYNFGQWMVFPMKYSVAIISFVAVPAISGNTSTAISEQITASCSDGGVVVFSATGLPSGVTCSSTGLISGTPTATGSFTATITMTSGYAAPAEMQVQFTIS